MFEALLLVEGKVETGSGMWRSESITGHALIVNPSKDQESYHYPEGQEQAVKEIWIFGALCLYWCDVELHI